MTENARGSRFLLSYRRAPDLAQRCANLGTHFSVSGGKHSIPGGHDACSVAAPMRFIRFSLAVGALVASACGSSAGDAGNASGGTNAGGAFASGGTNGGGGSGWTGGSTGGSGAVSRCCPNGCDGACTPGSVQGCGGTMVQWCRCDGSGWLPPLSSTVAGGTCSVLDAGYVGDGAAQHDASTDSVNDGPADAAWVPAGWFDGSVTGCDPTFSGGTGITGGSCTIGGKIFDWRLNVCSDYAGLVVDDGAYFVCDNSSGSCIFSVPGDGGGIWPCTWTKCMWLDCGTCVSYFEYYCATGGTP